MPVSGVTAWFRPESVLANTNWTNSGNAIDGDTNSFASYSFQITPSGWIAPSGFWGGFSAAAASLPVDAIVTGVEVKSRMRVAGTVATPQLSIFLRHSGPNPAIYSTNAGVTTSSGSIFEFTSSVTDLFYPITASELSNIVVEDGYSFGSSPDYRTWTGSVYDLQVRFTYLIPSNGKRFRDTGFKSGTVTGVNGTGSNTLAWSNPGNASVLDGAYATFPNGKDDTNVLFGSNWSFNIPINATPIALVPLHIVGPSHNHTYVDAMWNYRDSNGGALVSGGTGRSFAGWFGSKGLLNNSVSASTINSSWFGFGFRRESDAFESTQAQVDQFLAKVYFEEDATTGIILLAGF